MFEAAKALGTHLVVILNSDYQVGLKGSVPFMPEMDRKELIEAFKVVDKVIISVDKDKSVCKTLAMVKPDIFANGGDRRCENDIPEANVCKENNISMVFNVGGDKIRHSSQLIAKAINYAKNN
jgi:D-beta-D-heptose 7-phosphate kinase/D-beta-D-heptose 1-phosphate adenosyltransferase